MTGSGADGLGAASSIADTFGCGPYRPAGRAGGSGTLRSRIRRGVSASGSCGSAENPDVSGEKLAENVSSSMRVSRAAAASASANGVACSNRA